MTDGASVYVYENRHLCPDDNTYHLRANDGLTCVGCGGKHPTVDGRCPKCGIDDLQQWADDGESADADWWECEHCGASGAFADPNDPRLTVNGVLIDPKENLS